jgi:hypothetical protein
MLRVAAIILFALMLGFSAHSLRKMQEAGQLFDRYNSQRKASITLFGTSIIALLGLSAFEIRRMRKPRGARRYGEIRYTDQQELPDEVSKCSCIYASRTSSDDWPARRVGSSRSRSIQPRRSPPETWMAVLRIICLVIPCINIVLFSLLYLNSRGHPGDAWILPALCSVFVLLGIATAIGVFNRQGWGMSVGYLTAIINLVLFPIGTVMGLLLFIGLVGSSEIFSDASRKSAKRLRDRSFA